MNYRVKITTDLLDAPGGQPKGDLNRNEIVTGTGNKAPGHIEVKRNDGLVGWVRETDVEATERPAVNEEIFVISCAAAERTVNEQQTTRPWFISADFLIARAIIETKIENKGSLLTGSDAVGPLQVSSKEWARFRATPLGAGFQDGDYDDWVKQIRAAANSMFEAAKAFSAVKLQQNVGTAEDPVLPSLLDVLHTQLMMADTVEKNAKAAAAIADAEKTDEGKNKKIDQVLNGVLSGDEIKALCAARERFTGTIAAPNSIAAFVTATETALNDALKKAFDLIKQHAPEELPQKKRGEASWFDVAVEEEKLNIAEPNPRILTYFQGTGLNPGSTETPWCGAFANHCIRQAGLTPPTGPARAANWKTWGSEISFRSGEIPQGAVVVLAPSEGTGTSGHVAFFVRFLDNGTRIELLGGNQSNALNRKPFLTKRIAAVRWSDLPPDPDPAGAAPAPSGTPISQQAIDLIVAAEVTSGAVYEKKYRHPIWPKGMSGVTVGIGYDVGHQSQQQVANDWTGVISPQMVQRLQTACGVTGASAGPLAKSLADVDIPFDKAMQVFKTRDIPRWVAIVQRALPNTNQLSQNQLGALVSLAYNRGPSFAKAGDRYREMRNIKARMTDGALGSIPNEFRGMKRLWPDMAGLQRRRDDEANLFAAG